MKKLLVPTTIALLSFVLAPLSSANSHSFRSNYKNIKVQGKSAFLVLPNNYASSKSVRSLYSSHPVYLKRCPHTGRGIYTYARLNSSKHSSYRSRSRYNTTSHRSNNRSGRTLRF